MTEKANIFLCTLKHIQHSNAQGQPIKSVSNDDKNGISGPSMALTASTLKFLI